MDNDHRSEERREAERHRASIGNPQPKERKRAPRLPAEERRRQILGAAVDVFARRGLEGARTAEIAAAAGVQEATIYRHFESKDQLYREAVIWTMDEVLEMARQICDEADNPILGLRGIGVWFVGKMAENASELALRTRALVELTDQKLRKAVADRYMEYVELVREQHREAKRQGMLKGDVDTDVLSWLYLALGNHINMSWLLGLSDLKWVVVPEQVAKWQELWLPTDSNYPM